MKLIPMICTLSLLSLIAAHAKEANVETILNMYDKGSSATKQSIVAILSAMEDGIGWANAELRKRKDTPPLYCVPDGLFSAVNRYWKCSAKKSVTLPLPPNTPMA